MCPPRSRRERPRPIRYLRNFVLGLCYNPKRCSGHRPYCFPSVEGNLDCTETSSCYYRPSDTQPRQHYSEPEKLSAFSPASLRFRFDVKRGALCEASSKHSFRINHLPVLSLSVERSEEPPLQRSPFERFLDLPPELREHIYGYYIADYCETHEPSTYELPHPPPLTLVSKLVRTESQPIFFSQARFPLMIQRRVMPQWLLHLAARTLVHFPELPTILAPQDAQQWFTCCPPELLMRIRKLRLYRGRAPNDDPSRCRSYLVDVDPVDCVCTVEEEVPSLQKTGERPGLLLHPGALQPRDNTLNPSFTSKERIWRSEEACLNALRDVLESAIIRHGIAGRELLEAMMKDADEHWAL